MVLESLPQIPTVINHDHTPILFCSLSILLFLLLHLQNASTSVIVTFKIHMHAVSSCKQSGLHTESFKEMPIWGLKRGAAGRLTDRTNVDLSG